MIRKYESDSYLADQTYPALPLESILSNFSFCWAVGVCSQCVAACPQPHGARRSDPDTPPRPRAARHAHPRPVAVWPAGRRRRRAQQQRRSPVVRAPQQAVEPRSLGRRGGASWWSCSSAGRRTAPQQRRTGARRQQPRCAGCHAAARVGGAAGRLRQRGQWRRRRRHSGWRCGLRRPGGSGGAEQMSD